MYDPGGVRFGQGAGDLNGDIQRLDQFHADPCKTLAQGLPVNKFLRDEMDAPGFCLDLIDLKNGDDVRMVERRGGAGLLLEASHPLSIQSELLRQEFERQLASESRVLGEVNFSHTSPTQQRKNLVAAKLPRCQRLRVIIGYGLGCDLQGGLIQKVLGFLRLFVRRQQGFDFAAQLLIGRAGFVEKSPAPSDVALQCGLIQPVDLSPPLRSHLSLATRDKARRAPSSIRAPLSAMTL